jgi:hypothetical protein
MAVDRLERILLRSPPASGERFLSRLWEAGPSTPSKLPVRDAHVRAGRTEWPNPIWLVRDALGGMPFLGMSPGWPDVTSDRFGFY